MKNKGTQQARVGLFVSFGIVLSMLAIFLLGDGFSIFKKQYTLYARFRDASGLRLDAPVFLAGIQVGKVGQIVFAPDLQEREVVVKLEIKEEFKDRIRQDSEVTITTQGLLGDKALFVTVGTTASAALKDGDSLRVKESISFEALASRGTELLDNVNSLTQNVNALVDGVKNGDGLLHALIYDPKGKELLVDISDIARSAKGTLQSAKGVIQSAQGILSKVQKGSGLIHSLVYEPVRADFGQNLAQTAENLKSASSNLDAIAAKIEKGEGSIGGLVNDPTVYYDLMTLLGKANRNKLLRTVIRATLATNEKDLIESSK